MVYIDKVEEDAFHYITDKVTPQHKNPCLRGHEIYNFGRTTFFVHHCYILSLSDQCLWIEKIFFLNDAFSLYDSYGHALAQEPCPGGNKIYNFGRLFLGHHYYILSLSDLCQWIEEILKK